eukprot:15178-Heterococcus_DN1.PRE.11
MAQSSAPCHSVVEEHPSHLLKSNAIPSTKILKNADQPSKNKLPWWWQVLHPVQAKLMLSRPSLRREEECVVRSCSSSSSKTIHIYVDSDFAEAATACPSPNPCCKRRLIDAHELDTCEIRSINCWGQYTGGGNNGCASRAAIVAA